MDFVLKSILLMEVICRYRAVPSSHEYPWKSLEFRILGRQLFFYLSKCWFQLLHSVSININIYVFFHDYCIPPQSAYWWYGSEWFIFVYYDGSSLHWYYLFIVLNKFYLLQIFHINHFNMAQCIRDVLTCRV